MTLTILILCLVVTAFGSLGIRLYQLWKKVEQLSVERAALLGGIDWLKKELEKYRAGDLKVELTLSERRMIRNALESPGYRERVQDPATKRFIRDLYRALREKIKESTKEEL